MLPVTRRRSLQFVGIRQRVTGSIFLFVRLRSLRSFVVNSVFSATSLTH